MQFALHVVEHIDRAGLSARQLHCLGDDGGEHGFEIERRVHRLRHFAERAQLLNGAAKFVGALAQFVQQPSVLDCNDGLVGEILNQLDLLVGEGANFLAVKRERTNQLVLLEHWNAQDRSHTPSSTAETAPGSRSM